MTPRPGPVAATALLVLAVLLVASTLASGPAAADVLSRGRVLAFEEVDVVAGQTYARLTDGHARGMREEADEDGDGEVDQSEAAAFEERFRATLEQAQANRTRVDGAEPAGVEVIDLTLDGLVGPVHANASIDASVIYRLSFPGTADDGEVHLERTVVAADAGPWAVHGPPGYRVEGIEGLDDVALRSDDRLVEGRSDGEAAIQVVFSQAADGPGDGALPGPGLLGVLAGLAAAAAGTARRRPGRSDRYPRR